MDLAKLLEGYDGTEPKCKTQPMTGARTDALPVGPRGYAPQQDVNSTEGMGTFGKLKDLEAEGFQTDDPRAGWQDLGYIDQVDSVKIGGGGGGAAGMMMANLSVPEQDFDWEPTIVFREEPAWEPLHTKDTNQDG
jgi:hypothetical protein